MAYLHRLFDDSTLLVYGASPRPSLEGTEALPFPSAAPCLDRNVVRRRRRDGTMAQCDALFDGVELDSSGFSLHDWNLSLFTSWRPLQLGATGRLT